MKINIVTGAFLPTPPGPSGACEKIWARLAKELTQLGHKVTLLGRDHPGLPSQVTEDSVRILRTVGFKRVGKQVIDLPSDLLYSFSILRSLPTADITVTNTFFLPVLTIFQRRAGKVVVSVERYPKGQLSLYAKSARLRTPSSEVERVASEQSPGIAHLLKTIPNPVDVEAFSPESQPSPHNARQILYAGRIAPEKGIHLLVNSFRLIHANFPDVSLKLLGPSEIAAGGGGPEYVQRIKNASQGLPVEIAAAVTDPNELAREMKSATLFCYPSIAERGESFGVAPLEAMAAGLPVVLSDLAVFRDFLQPGKNGLTFNHRSADAESLLAEQIKSLLREPQRCQSMGALARASALRFSYPQIAKQLSDDFANLAA